MEKLHGKGAAQAGGDVVQILIRWVSVVTLMREIVPQKGKKHNFPIFFRGFGSANLWSRLWPPQTQLLNSSRLLHFSVQCWTVRVAWASIILVITSYQIDIKRAGPRWCRFNHKQRHICEVLEGSGIEGFMKMSYQKNVSRIGVDVMFSVAGDGVERDGNSGERFSNCILDRWLN